MDATKARVCELCSREEATLYCASDSAFLCFTCDSNVHRANFLVARHHRRPICSLCQSFAGILFSGTASLHLGHLCYYCSLENELETALPSSPSSSCSSACLSSTESKPTKITFSSSSTDDSGEEIERSKSRSRTLMEAKEEGIFVNWCKNLGVNRNSWVSSMASRAFGICLKRLPVLPFRVSMAASFWLAVRLCGDRSVATWQNLKRFEKVSGVPAKLILAVGMRLASDQRVMRARSRRDLKEGWAES